MCDAFYNDTMRAYKELGDIDFEFLNNELQENISSLLNEVGYILDEYQQKQNLIEHYEQVLCDNDIELTTP